MAGAVGNGLPCRSVARGSRWGNPFVYTRLTNTHCGPVDFSQCPARHSIVDGEMVYRGPCAPMLRDATMLCGMDEARHAAAAGLYRALVTWWRDHDPAAFAAWIDPLTGHNLGCWCAPALPCHADVLLELANTPAPARTDGRPGAGQCREPAAEAGGAPRASEAPR